MKKSDNTLDNLFKQLSKDSEFIKEYLKQKPFYDKLLHKIKSKEIKSNGR